MAFCAKTLPPSPRLRRTGRATTLLTAAVVGSNLTARCGDARSSPPRLRSKSLVAEPLLVLKQALRENDVKNRWIMGLLGAAAAAFVSGCVVVGVDRPGVGIEIPLFPPALLSKLSRPLRPRNTCGSESTQSHLATRAGPAFETGNRRLPPRRA
jgi:hypothetical protein